MSGASGAEPMAAVRNPGQLRRTADAEARIEIPMSAILEPSPVARLTCCWWLALVRGLTAIAFGFVVLLSPEPSLRLFAWIFSVYAAADGLASLLTAVFSPQMPARAWLGMSGLATLAAAGLAAAAPALVQVSLVLVIGAWAVARGLGEIAAAALLDRYIAKPWALGLGGLISLLLGAVVLAAGPAVGVLAISWLIGGCSIAFGAAAIAWAIRLRSLTS